MRKSIGVTKVGLALCESLLEHFPKSRDKLCERVGKYFQAVSQAAEKLIGREGNV